MDERDAVSVFFAEAASKDCWRTGTPSPTDHQVTFVGKLARSSPFSRARFHDSYAAVLSADDACLMVVADSDGVLGCLLGFSHRTFYANGPVAWVEEVLVRPQARGRGIGRALMQVLALGDAAELRPFRPGYPTRGAVLPGVGVCGVGDLLSQGAADA